ncbi:MAG TPA: protein kinase, partial [Myxococcota bacterium]
LDFGVAKIVDQEVLTQTGMTMGTPGYMAPELAVYGVSDDPRLDFYALGVILFECLTGRSPFYAESIVELVMKHVKEKPVAPGIAKDVDALVLALLEKEPADRPQTAAEIVSRIDALANLATTPVLSAPPVALTTSPTAITLTGMNTSLRSEPAAVLAPPLPSPSRFPTALAACALAAVVVAVAAALLLPSAGASATTSSATTSSATTSSATTSSAITASATTASATTASATTASATTASATTSSATTASTTSSATTATTSAATSSVSKSSTASTKRVSSARPTTSRARPVSPDEKTPELADH